MLEVCFSAHPNIQYRTKLIKKQTFLYAFIFFRLYLPQQNILKYGELKYITAAIIEMLYAIYKPIKQSALFMVKL